MTGTGRGQAGPDEGRTRPNRRAAIATMRVTWKAERPSHFGSRGERFDVGARHCLRDDGPEDDLGLGVFDSG